MWTEVLVAVFASSGFWAVIQYVIQRRDGRKKQLDEISDKLTQLSEKVDANAAVLARTHILRFSDELSNGIQHSQEYFRQQLDDIDTYEEFCINHPSFRNSYTVMAADHIRRTYEVLLARQAFALKGDEAHENE